MRRRLLVCCFALPPLACNATCGADELRFDSDGANGGVTSAGGTGGAGGEPGSGGGGGAGGDGGPMAASDWSSSMLALYLFEDPNDVGRDSSGNAHDFGVYGDPLTTDQGAPEGLRAVMIDALDGAGDGLDTDAPGFASPAGTSVTFGGWFRVTDDANQSDVVGRGAAMGYAMRRDGNLDRAICMIGDGDWTTAIGPGNSWPPSEWVHVVCRFDDAADTATGFVAGVAYDSVEKSDIGNQDTAFGIPRPASQLTGEADEVFAVMQALDDAEVLRLFACGVTGARCLCDPDAPAGYLDCGLIDPSCASLPACDAAGPAPP